MKAQKQIFHLILTGMIILPTLGCGTESSAIKGELASQSVKVLKVALDKQENALDEVIKNAEGGSKRMFRKRRYMIRNFRSLIHTAEKFQLGLDFLEDPIYTAIREGVDFTKEKSLKVLLAGYFKKYKGVITRGLSLFALVYDGLLDATEIGKDPIWVLRHSKSSDEERKEAIQVLISQGDMPEHLQCLVIKALHGKNINLIR